jgi:hypothetical protein
VFTARVNGVVVREDAAIESVKFVLVVPYLNHWCETGNPPSEVTFAWKVAPVAVIAETLSVSTTGAVAR